MRIALDVTPILTDHKVRGIGSYTYNLVGALKKYDKRNSYIFFTRGEKLPKDVNLVHYPYFEPFFLTLPLRKITKTVVTIHDLIPLAFEDKFPAGLKGKIKWTIQKFSLNGVKAILTDSENSKRDIVKITGFPSDKIKVIYLASAPEFRKLENGGWKLEIKQKYQLPDVFVLYVGDATWNKNIPGLIEAVKTLNLNLVLVGKQVAEKDFDHGNPWNRDLVKIEKMSQGDKRIIKPGFVPLRDLVAIYNLATVYCQPSFYEGFGLPVLEAMVCGCPVVASNTSSLPEVCQDAAVMVDPYNVNDIVKGLKMVLEDQSIADSYRKKGFVQARKFNWQKVVKELIQVYETVSS